VNERRKRLVWIIVIAVAVLLALWLDRKHPFPVHVIRNGPRLIST